MRQKLLLADDSITVQRVIELTLADEGLEVLTVGDGEQAIASLEREQPDIVLADLNMPGRDGYGVAEYVKHSPAFVDRTRVVLLTGAFEPIDQARADRLGIDGVLAKPFEPQVAID
jgi:CheY-like chemotaxis protein